MSSSDFRTSACIVDYGSRFHIIPEADHFEGNPTVNPDLLDFHLGVNLSLSEFDVRSGNILERGYEVRYDGPEIWVRRSTLRDDDVSPSLLCIENQWFQPDNRNVLNFTMSEADEEAKRPYRLSIQCDL